MTNEEKAKEIANLCEHCIESDGKPCDGCMECESRGSYYGAIEMAEYKDDYIKKVLEDKLSCFKKSHSEYMKGVCDGITSVYNRLFSEK